MISSQFFYYAKSLTDSFINEIFHEICLYYSNKIFFIDEIPIDKTTFDIVQYAKNKPYIAISLDSDAYDKGNIDFFLSGNGVYSKVPQSITFKTNEVLYYRFILKLISHQGFTFGFEIDYDFSKLQNITNIRDYESNFGCSLFVKKVKDRFGRYMIDISENSGKGMALNHMGFNVGWRMWFGEYAQSLFGRELLIKSLADICHDLRENWDFEGDVLIVTLYDKPVDIYNKSIQRRALEYRKRINAAEVEEREQLLPDTKIIHTINEKGEETRVIAGGLSEEEVESIKQNHKLSKVSFWEYFYKKYILNDKNLY